MRERNSLVVWVAILLFSAAAGAFYSIAVARDERLVFGTVFGLFIGVPMLAFSRGMFLTGVQQRLRRLPFPLYAPASLALYTLMIIVSTGLAGGLFWALGEIKGNLLDAIAVSRQDLIYSLTVLAIILFVLRIRDLIGGSIFQSLLTGRYHKPISEERIFLFVDLAGSTRFAERFGDLRAQEYLARFFETLAEPVRRYQGAIDDYVGDLAIITWPLQRGVKDARCVRCVFALRERIEREAQSWQSRFGTTPKFRAALHGGLVVAAEIGVDRHKITYFGDTVNTTARLESLCRELDTPILISAELLARMPALPARVRATDLGSHDLRGRDHPLAIAALTSVCVRSVKPENIAA